MKLAFFGSSLVSAMWNGAATYYRGILRSLAARGFDCVFYEPDAYDRQKHRDIADPPWCRVRVWPATREGALRAVEEARGADLVVKASGVGVLDGLLEEAVLSLQSPRTQIAFWDVDAPATLERVRADKADPFRPLIPRYDLILTYGGGPPVVSAYQALGARRCVPIYNAVDPQTHHPVPADPRFEGDLGFLANRLPDREARANEFFFQVARALPNRRFILGGSGWEAVPANVNYAGHVYTRDHNAFNVSPLAVLNVCRDSMASYGFSPATRVFEAAGAGGCLVSDAWEGLQTFLEPGREVLVASSRDDVIGHLSELSPQRAKAIGQAAQERVLREHTYDHRTQTLCEVLGVGRKKKRPSTARRNAAELKIVFLGLSITSSWGNGHATTYRGLVRELSRRGHDVTFLERDVPWYAAHRDPVATPSGRTILYSSVQELEARHRDAIASADVVVVGSYVPDGREVGDLVLSHARGPVAFYDIDTPVTLSDLERDSCAYLRRDQVPRYALYLSFTGGPILRRIQSTFGSPNAQPLYCSVDTELYRAAPVGRQWDLSFMGTYSDDRQPAVDRLLIQPARTLEGHRFVVAGAQYPSTIRWPANVERITHVAPDAHVGFYGASRLTLNLTRRDMVAAGHSPSVRLFEAAACGVAIASDTWPGLESFFEPEKEILLVEDPAEVVELVARASDDRLAGIAAAANRRVLAHHTARDRAATFEAYVRSLA
jgi:spore maturation protein CgeB